MGRVSALDYMAAVNRENHKALAISCKLRRTYIDQGRGYVTVDSNCFGLQKNGCNIASEINVFIIPDFDLKAPLITVLRWCDRPGEVDVNQLCPAK